MQKILLFLAVWKRPEITELCFMGIKRLREYDRKRFKVEALAVISEPSMKALCKKYNIDFIEHENLPLGKKKNAGLAAAFTKEWDYLIEMGSDDLLRNEVLDVYEPLMQKNEPLINLNQIVFANSANGEATYFTTDGCFGLGRAMSRNMLEAITGRVEVEAIEPFFTAGVVVPFGKRDYINPVTARELAAANFVKITSAFTYHLWKDEINRGLDNASNYLLEANGVKATRITTGEPLAMDVKGPDNIWPYDASLGVPYNINEFLKHVSEAERRAFFGLVKKTVTKAKHEATV